ncbi:MAG TPA: hypothetical protein VGX68_24505 [Thermoanaerobaculia bacterium]|jgi:ABC-type phosphate transport system substrate-binding protein|nr:hypothetical protein [Thermoanaerobaculia bacterium]
MLFWKNRRSFTSLRSAAVALPGVIAIACFGLFVHRSGAAEPALVIVNSANPVSGMHAEEVSEAFLKKAPRWPDGVEIVPVDLSEGSAVREAFSRRVHSKPAAAVKAYWQRMIFSGREVPPPEKATGADVVAFVRTNRGAIGYVGIDTVLGSGVKVIRID